MSTEQLRNCFIGFYIGDAFGSSYDLKPPRAADKIKFRSVDETRDWTENGDIVAAILRNRHAPITKTIKECYEDGLKEIEHPPMRGFSIVAKKLLGDENWSSHPTEVAQALAHKGPHALINLPVATSIGIIGAHRDCVEKYAALFVADKLVGVIACMYSKAIAAALELSEIDSENIIAVTLNTYHNEGKCERELVDDAICYSQTKLSDLELNKQPIHAINSLKIICYALRIVEHAQAGKTMPDLMRVLQFICSAGGDTSTNCALALSIICAAKYDGNRIIDTSALIKRVKHGDWILKVMQMITIGR